MVKNNIEVDVKVKCIEQGKTQAKLADKVHRAGKDAGQAGGRD